MGMKANSGFFHGTSGNPAVGDANFMGTHQNFLKFISKRKDIDANGFFDVVGHGTSTYIQIDRIDPNCGNELQTLNIDWRVTAKIIKNSKGYHGQGIRLLSCNTGKTDDGFAQNLANKLKVPVQAPISYLYANPDGTYYVAEDKGTYKSVIKNGFKTFYPKRSK